MGIRGNDLGTSVTIMPILGRKIGFLRRDLGDSYPNLLIAPGGSMETTDGTFVDGVKYHSVEYAAARELWEKAGIKVPVDRLTYFCSMSLSSPRVVISLWCSVNYTQIARSYGFLEFYAKEEIKSRDDFAPGMKQEALALLEKLGL